MAAVRDNRPLVLILDADETARDLYAHWFILLGFGVMCAVGSEGVSWVLHQELPDLIVTELKIGDLSFSDLMKRLTFGHRTRCVPVVVITACEDSAARVDAKAAGAVAVLRKFADFARLGQWVTAVVQCDSRDRT